MVFSGENARREILYEEMHPYGTSAYRSAPSATEVSARRYRYTGKERDEETGLDYFGARYYAPWLGRWTSADPLGLQAGLNLYGYCRGSPVVMVDPNGMDTLSWEEIRWRERQPDPEPALQLTGENPKLYKDENTEIRGGPGGKAEYVTKPPDLSGMAQPSQGRAQEVPQPPGFERGHAEPPEPYTLKQAFEDVFIKPFVGEAGAPTNEADVARQRPRIGEGEFAFNVATLRGAFFRVGAGVKALAQAEEVAAGASRLPKGARGPISGREFDPSKAGGPIRSLTTKGVKVTPKGIEAVEAHLARFGADEANDVMVSRLRRIASGELEATPADLNFYTHELRESVRYRKLGHPTGAGEDYELWNNAHTATLEEYGISEQAVPHPLYHPSARPK